MKNLWDENPQPTASERRRVLEARQQRIPCTEKACPYAIIGAPWSHEQHLSDALLFHPSVSLLAPEPSKRARGRQLESLGDGLEQVQAQNLVQGSISPDALYGSYAPVFLGTPRVRVICLLREPVERALIEAEHALGGNDGALEELVKIAMERELLGRRRGEKRRAHTGGVNGREKKRNRRAHAGGRGRRQRMMRWLVQDTALAMRDCNSWQDAESKLSSYAEVLNGTLFALPVPSKGKATTPSQCAINPFMLRSNYAKFLPQWLAARPGNMLVEAAETVARNPELVLQDAVNFLGLRQEQSWMSSSSASVARALGADDAAQLALARDLLGGLRPLERCTLQHFFQPHNARLNEILLWAGQRPMPWASSELQEQATADCSALLEGAASAASKGSLRTARAVDGIGVQLASRLLSLSSGAAVDLIT